MIIEEWETREEPCNFKEILDTFTKTLLDSQLILYNTTTKRCNIMCDLEKEEIEKLRWLIEVQSLLTLLHFPPNNEEGRSELVKIAQNALTEAGY